MNLYFFFYLGVLVVNTHFSGNILKKNKKIQHGRSPMRTRVYTSTSWTFGQKLWGSAGDVTSVAHHDKIIDLKLLMQGPPVHRFVSKACLVILVQSYLLSLKSYTKLLQVSYFCIHQVFRFCTARVYNSTKPNNSKLASYPFYLLHPTCTIF